MSDVYNTLVVAGGASKCISAIGSIYYLTENGILDFVENYIGTSAGGIICYLLTIGYTPFEIIHFLCKSNFIEEFQSLNLTGILERKGLINYYIIHDYIEKLTLAKIGFCPTLKDIRIRFGKNLTLVAHNLTRNVIEYLNADLYPDLPCLTAIRMSISVPILFERFFYNNCEYIDGGILDNFPVNYYDKPGYKTIGINVNPNTAVANNRSSYIQYLLQLMWVPYNYYQSQKQISERVTVISIDTGVISFDFNLSITKRLDLFSKGYQKTKQVLTRKEVTEPPKLEAPPPAEEVPSEAKDVRDHEPEEVKLLRETIAKDEN